MSLWLNYMCCRCDGNASGDQLHDHILHNKLLPKDNDPIIVTPKVGDSDSPSVVQPSSPEIYIVQWNYKHLLKGHRVQVEDLNLSDNEQIYLTVRSQDGKIINVPRVCLTKIKDVADEPWYFINITTRDHAQLVLLNADSEDGLYLIRKCETATVKVPYVLSIKRQITGDDGNGEDESFHVEHIQVFENNGLYGGEGKETFVTLAAMVDHFIETGFLTKPCPKDLVININQSEIHTSIKLGHGEFGEVVKGTWRNHTVAIKYMHDAADFQDEIKLICQFNHPQIVQMYGANISSSPQFMVMEYMCNDSLLNYMHNNKLSLQENLYILKQIADGMRFLEKYMVLHRDLAARNVLMGENCCAKIADFGLSRKLGPESDYYRTTAKKLPILWLAPESFTNYIFTTKSDVWMFGILSMEVFQRGLRPYNELNMSNFDKLERINDGYRMPRVESMPENFYLLLTKCWQVDPRHRPTFNEVYQHFLPTKHV